MRGDPHAAAQLAGQHVRQDAVRDAVPLADGALPGDGLADAAILRAAAVSTELLGLSRA